MINEDPNMGRKQIFNELPLPSKVKEVTLELIYKALFIIVKLLLDSRLNLVKISEGKAIKTKHKDFQRRGQKSSTEKPVEVENPIKGLDNIKIENKTVTKVDEKKEDIPSSKEKPDQIKLGEDTKPTPETDSGEKSTEQGEKIDEATNNTNKPSKESESDNVDPTIDL